MGNDKYVRDLEAIGEAIHYDTGTFDTLVSLAHPEIPWTRPIPIAVEGREPGVACRLCIARLGFQAASGEIFADVNAFVDHLSRKHPAIVT